MSLRSAIAITSLSAVVVCGLAACASSGTTRPAQGSPDRITSAEIEAVGAFSAFDIVNRLRPHWLRAGPASISGGRATTLSTLVYLDGLRLGGLDMLRTIPAAGIRSMQFLDAARAPTILQDIGPDPIAGAILISTAG